MISFRDCTRELVVKEHLRRLRMLARTGDAESFLVEAGVLEQAVVDFTCAREERWGAVQALFRDLLLAAGRAYVMYCDGKPVQRSLAAAFPVLDTLTRTELPDTLSARVPEGYLHYALDPGDYVRAAFHYVHDVGVKQAEEAVVLGVRSIGTSLSGVVAAATGSPVTLTLRPRGESGRRYVTADAALTACMRAWIVEGRDMLIVDEGPGATGETLFCIGRWLRQLGAKDTQTVLFPSHTGGMGLAPEERKTWFAAQRKYPPPVDDARMNRIAEALSFSDPENLSGGLWRRVVQGGALIPASVNHERLKYRVRDTRGGVYVLRYAGLGEWGQEVFERARCLGMFGVTPEAVGFSHGFMAYRWQEGAVGMLNMASSSFFHRAVGGYLAARWGRFATGKTATPASLIPALRENACEALGANPTGLKEAVRRLEKLPEREAVIADARMQLAEWIDTTNGFVKIDAWDHGDGTRLPGPVDAAWDVAAAVVEYGWDEKELAVLLDRLSLQPIGRRELELAISAYRAPYAASCLGEADISAREVYDENDRRLLECQRERYRRALQSELDRACSLLS